MAADSISPSTTRRFSPRRQPLDRSFLYQRLRGARAYDRIAGYFCSSLLEVAGEELESVTGPVRMVCNSDLTPADVLTARATQMAVRRSRQDQRIAISLADELRAAVGRCLAGRGRVGAGRIRRAVEFASRRAAG
jgi:hypothetical protein